MRAIINILQNDTALTTLLGGSTQIGANVIGQTKKAPYVVVDLEDEEVTNAFRAPSGVNFERISIFSVADLTFTSGSIVGADEVSKAVRNALNFVAPGTYDGEVITRCTFQRGLKMQEDRISNKPQITKEDEYLLTVRPSTDSGFDVDAQLIFDQMTNPTETQKTAINNRVVSMKDGGYWDIEDEFIGMSLGDVTVENGLLKWHALTLATAEGGGSFVLNGFVSNGTNAIIKTGVIPNDQTNYSSDDAHARSFIYVADTGDTFNSPFGDISNGNRKIVSLSSGTALSFRMHSNSAILPTREWVQGMYTTIRDGANSFKLFIDGVQEGSTNTSASVGSPTEEIYIGALNNNGTGSQFFDGTQPLWGLGKGIGWDEAAVNTIDRKFLTDLGLTLI